MRITSIGAIAAQVCRGNAAGGGILSRPSQIKFGNGYEPAACTTDAVDLRAIPNETLNIFIQELPGVGKRKARVPLSSRINMLPCRFRRQVRMSQGNSELIRVSLIH